MSLDQLQLALIQQQIRSAQQTTSAVGTCQTRDSLGSGATVQFDGSTVAVPAKVLGSVSLQEGGRCVLHKFGDVWVVTGSFSGFRLGEAVYHNLGSTSESTSSAAYVDLVQIPPITFTKVYDNTWVRMSIRGTAFQTVAAGSVLRFGLHFTPTGDQVYAASDYNVALLAFNSLSVFATVAGFARYTGFPAGPYTVQLRWRRSTGTGTFTFNTDSEVSIEVDERVQYASPIL